MNEDAAAEAPEPEVRHDPAVTFHLANAMLDAWRTGLTTLAMKLANQERVNARLMHTLKDNARVISQLQEDLRRAEKERDAAREVLRYREQSEAQPLTPIFEVDEEGLPEKTF
jgi:uncharacterized coiled-coil protein SlyX